MTQLPNNRRRDDALRRYMLAADTLAALAEMMLDSDDDAPYARALRNSIHNLDLAKVGVRANGANPFEPVHGPDDTELVIGAAPDRAVLDSITGLAHDLEARAARTPMAYGLGD
jgi:hypothetical protein